MKYLPLLFLLNIGNSWLVAQVNPLQLVDDSTGRIWLNPYLEVLEDQTINMDWKAALIQQEQNQFISLDSFSFSGQLERGKYAYWIYLNVDNQQTKAAQMIFRLEMDSVQFYQIVEGQLVDYKLTGLFANRNFENHSEYAYFKYDIPFTLFPKKRNKILVRFRGLPSFTPENIQPILFNEELSITQKDSRFFSFIFSNSIYLGMLFFIMIFNLTQYFQNKDQAYLYYTFYVGAIFVFVLRGFLMRYPLFLPIPIEIIHTKYYTLFALLIKIFYLLFLRTFLNTKKEYPRLDLFIKSAFWFVGIYFVVERTAMYFDLNTAYRLEKFFRPAFGLLFLVTFILLFRRKDKSASFIFWGVFSLLFFLVMSYCVDFLDNARWQRWDIGYILSEMGMLVELLFFSAGLGYKTKMIGEEKSEIQRNLITQLQSNQLLKEQLHQNLVNKQQQLKAQLKPHFIFNCLTSIKNLIVRDKKEAAETYLILFAELIREVLHFAEKEQVTLEEELLFAENYLKLEEMRFKDRFTYSIRRNQVATTTIFLPPMLLQPFIENAIKHGLLPKEGHRALIISLTQHESSTLCTIQDNGIGRAEAARLATQFTKHKSRGIDLIRAQIASYNELFNTHIQFQIIDLSSPKGQVQGTRVEILIPLQ